ncbi:MAG: beta-1,6-N-acetylglucosaminyltransferase [Flavobacteriales bacterium]
MRHAFLITAYRDPEALLELLDGLPAGSTAYVHYDRRSDLSSAMAARLQGHGAVRYWTRRHRVRWGGRAHLLAMLELSRAAVKDGAAERLHLISGSDRVVVPDTTFFAHFERAPDAEYLVHFALPTPYWRGGGLDRLTHYHPLDLLDLRSVRQRRLRDLFLRLQHRMGIHRPLPKDVPLFGGSSWWSLSRTCVAEVLALSDAHPALLRRLRWTHVPEEIFFPTLVMAGASAARAVNDNLRYIDWVPRDGRNPAVLDERDLTAIVASGKLFARKLERPTSSGLIQALNALRRGQ